MTIYKAFEEYWKFNESVCSYGEKQTDDWTSMHAQYDAECIIIISERTGNFQFGDDATDEPREGYASWLHLPKKRKLFVEFPGSIRRIAVDYESFEQALMQHSLEGAS